MTSRLALQDHLFSAADRAPEHAAHVRAEHRVSYGALTNAAQRFGNGLLQLGVQPGDRVGVMLDGRVEYLIAYYGALLAGAAVVPICPDTRTDILHWPLSHAEVSILVLEGTNARYLAGQAVRLPALRTVVALGKPIIEDPGRLEIVDFDALVSASPPLSPGVTDGADDSLASIVYTSGTTGRPKGVMLSHRNLVSNVRSIVQYLELTAADSIGMVLPYYYVYGTSVLHTHVLAGATIHDLGSMAFAQNVLDGLVANRCTGFSGVPSTFARLLQLEGLAQADLGALRYVTQAGAAMSTTLAAALQQKLPRTRIFVMYGQTEASARLSYLPPEELARKPGSIGRAIPGVTLRVCDAAGNELPPRTQGELVASGDNIMMGYWRDPEETARVLRPDGLHTRDLATMDEEGYFFVVGRESDMIKSGAHRIAPQEIEDALLAHPDVKECAVVGLPDELLGERIVAFTVLAPGVKLQERALLRHCFERLPRYKMPAEVREIAELPTTSNGKLNRAELRRKHR